MAASSVTVSSMGTSRKSRVSSPSPVFSTVSTPRFRVYSPQETIRVSFTRMGSCVAEWVCPEMITSMPYTAFASS